MGLLSRRRKQPRIVKKVKTSANRRQISVKQVDPRLRKHWDQDKSVAENFQNIGLRLNTNPSLKQSKEGRETAQGAQKLYLDNHNT
jgi:Ribosome biogenesis protein Nop16